MKPIKINMERAVANAESGKKVSTAGVCGDVEKFIKGAVIKIAAKMMEKDEKADVSTAGDGQVIPIMRLIGLAHGYQNGDGDNGPWTALKGDFLAVKLMGETNFDEPKSKRAGKAFVPAGGETMIVSALIQSDGGAVQVGVDVFARIDSTSLRGYEYFLKSITEPTANDPLMALAAECKPLELPSSTD